jgi:hypothetical protein
MLKVITRYPKHSNAEQVVEIEGTAQRVEFTLFDGNGEPQKCWLIVGYDRAFLGVEGYGSQEDVAKEGTVVALDVYHKDAKNPYQGKTDAQVAVWADINDSDPTFVVSLADARLELRD